MMIEKARKNDFKEKREAAKRERKEAFKKSGKSSSIGNTVQDGNVYATEGITTISGGVFDTLIVTGICKSKADIQAKRMNVEGTFECNGSVMSDVLFCEGMAKIKGNVRAEELQVEGMMEIKGRLEANEIICEGFIHVKGEISADLIEAEGAVLAEEIVGDKVLIHSKVHGITIPLLEKKQIINLIEATTIELRRVKAREVNGENIRIGYKCIIDHVDCSGSLYVDPTARVGEITGDYTRLTQ